MQHYRQWSAAFASYFTIIGLWTAFGPNALMATDPGAAPLSLAAIALSYFVATPFVRKVWIRFGFSTTLVFMGLGVCASLCTAAFAPQWLAWCMPMAFFFGSGSYTLCETKMLEDLAQAGQGHAFGRARKWGSFGFLAAAALGGAAFSVGGVDRTFTASLALCALAYFACCVALALACRSATDGAKVTPAAQEVKALRTTLPALAQHAIAAQSTPRRRFAGAGAVTGLRLAEAISTTWFGAYWLRTGHSPLETGLLCALPVAAEFWAMWKGGHWLARTSPAAVMLVCSAASALRWLATPFCSQLWCAVPLQSLHAFTFGFFYPAALIWLKHEFAGGFFQARYATESVSRGLTAAVTYLAAGWIITQYGYGAVYAVSCTLAVLCSLWWWRVLRS
jgi:PPP family 3-phenylpropionic acid transporter